MVVRSKITQTFLNPFLSSGGPVTNPWNTRFDRDEYVYGTEPNAFLLQSFKQIPNGRVLCLGEGEGRNAVFLAEQGYEVVAVDASNVGLDKAQRLAETRGVQIETRVADLTDYDLGQEQWQGIVSIFCHLPPELRQSVHARIAPALAPQGSLLLEGYTPDQLAHGTGGPPSVEMLYHPAMLQQDFANLTINWLEAKVRDVTEGIGHTGTGAVVQLIARKI